MNFAILADIHANLTALEAVLKDIEDHGGADEIWCLGDIVGYGPDPHECIELLKNRCSVCVAGNHDWAAIGKMDTSYFNPEAAEANFWTSQHLHLEDIHFLESLPLTLVKGDFTLVHGSPRDPIWEYVLSVAEAEENLKHFQTRYCLIGHSHLPLLFECGKYCTLTELTPPPDSSSRAGRKKVGLSPDENQTFETRIQLGEKRLIINPGGVGQPRDNDPRAGYAIYDNEAGVVIIRRVGYDISTTQQKMVEARLPEWLIQRLANGQ
jgi:diadenosine tetraphosphatase ApaH/serine/threonine PP2A family protein phosphatase